MAQKSDQLHLADDELEREGPVARINSADDARGAYATLTDRGRA